MALEPGARRRDRAPCVTALAESLIAPFRGEPGVERRRGRYRKDGGLRRTQRSRTTIERRRADFLRDAPFGLGNAMLLRKGQRLVAAAARRHFNHRTDFEPRAPRVATLVPR